MSLDFGRFDCLKTNRVGSKNLPNPVPTFGARYPFDAPDRIDFIKALTQVCENEKGRQYVGIEVELERVKYVNNKLWDDVNTPLDFIRQFNSFWEIKEDGSLRDNGAEFVSQKGLTVELLPIALHALEQYIKTAVQAGVNANARTGLHVHFNVGGMDLYTLCNILFLYAVYEPVFFYVSGNRDDSIFSVPWHKNRVSIGSVINNLMTTIEDEGYGTWRWRNYSKYCALNLSTIESYGTIEFRMHEGTMCKERIEKWAKTINNLFLYAKSTDLIENIKKFRTGRQEWKYLEGLFIIFSEYTYDIFNIREQLIHECKYATLALFRGFIDYTSLPLLGGNDAVRFGEDRGVNLGELLARRLRAGGEAPGVRLRIPDEDEYFDGPEEPQEEPEADDEQGEF